MPIFEKVGRQLELSEYGERLFDECLEVLDRLEGLRERVGGADDDVSGLVTVGTFPTVARHLLLEAIEELLAEHPNLRVNFRFTPAEAQLDALRTARVDVLVFVGEVDTTRFEAYQLGETRLVAVMAPSLAPKDGVEISDLRNMRYLAWSGPSDPTFDAARRYTTRHNIRDDRTPEIPHIEALRALARRGVGFTILPDYTTLRDVADGRLVTVPLVGLEQSIPIRLLTRDRQTEGRALRHVRKTFHSAIAELL